MPAALTFFFAFLAVLLLIGGVAWLIRRFAGNRLGTNTNRGRMPRLAVIDAAAVDGRRRLVLVRRDNIEHLLMIGGPTDIVVEPNIVRGVSGREQPRSAVAAPDAQQPRVAPLPDAGWNEPETLRAESLEPELPTPEPSPRPARPAFADEPRRPTRAERNEQRNERSDRNDPLAGFTAESINSGPVGGGRSEPRPEPMMPPRLPRSEPTMPRSTPRPIDPPKPPPPIRAERPAPPSPPPPPIPPQAASTTGPATSSADQNLAEMAQRLEAALRRPAGTPDPVAPPVAPEPPAARPAPRSEPVATSSPPAAPIKTGFENLEDEMASLLGRPKTPS